jgi:hypothetical protein
MRYSLIGTLAIFTAGTAVAQAPNELKLTRPAVSGMDSLLSHEHAWDQSCTAQPTQITITKKLEHGTISITQGSSTNPDSVPRTGSTGQCARKIISGNDVMYKSEPDFQGTDAVSYIVEYRNGRQGPTSITINVK